ncbi:A24 family peptidase C-terminal domain-containing protein [Natronolimnohabitans sp. A-GB9]|uniref:A24 family peptidase C-terminal domain-containing protein n=1 Tax=Natronolimnohabitans sp. A-GB9 TaxID=3069757 RepID=UPI0027ADCAC5|nr:A24 family peptidase C-terminal domain-containing protein [Natronolimnohabitans sp. A-GB9]MDQ2051870.1 A24 family peptidase C-terminal domain-containing protein [Natronolimnohabitans sp. A-GB9]
MTLAGVAATAPDLLRLVAVPVFAWVAVRDIKTRRVSSTVWIPLALVGAVALVWDGWLAWSEGGYAWSHEFLLPTAVSLGFVVPIAYLFWWFGGFGGADAKALLVLALLFPTFPQYAVGSWTLPATTTPIGTFSFTVLTNAVVVGLLVPVALAARNAVAGRVTPVMAIGWPVPTDRLPETHGRLLETPEGPSRGGLDLDALRMYLRWRGLTLADVREDPDRYRDPATLPERPNPPTDGAVTAAVESDGGAASTDTDDRGRPSGDHDASAIGGATSTADDPWGAEAFLADIEGTAYGTRPEELREGLEVISETETVWISPGTPFLVPVFVGLTIALVYGDLLVGTII